MSVVILVNNLSKQKMRANRLLALGEAAFCRSVL